MDNMENENKGKVRQYRSNQGRDPRQQRGNEIAGAVSVIGLILTFIGMALYNYFNYSI
tara:strand:- start:28 stop:201 length:174 start_codon:yes stop_codon:yes gene_type:complete